MPLPKYPLRPLVRVRETRVDQAASCLAAAACARDAAARARTASEQRRDEHAATVEDVRCAEKGALSLGNLRVTDLVRRDAWEVGVAVEQSALASVVEQARADEDRARSGEGRARERAALLKAEAQLVDRHRVRWTEAERKRAEIREEDALLEAWRPPRS
jgi:hypothetical protein